MADTSTVVVGPYSPIRQAGNLYFVSGCIGLDPATKTARFDVESQTHQALANLESALKSVQLDLQSVVKTTVFLTDMGDFQTVNNIYAAKFAHPFPARSAVAVAELPRVAAVALKIEIEAIATTA
jgi:2-iminobutanoate/2-iminopropanoate deaminase